MDQNIYFVLALSIVFPWSVHRLTAIATGDSSLGWREEATIVFFLFF